MNAKKQYSMKFWALVLCLILALAAVGPVMAQVSSIIIQDTATGGQCTTVGVWNDATKTCTLNQDVSDPVRIGGQGITLDGGGHTITPNGQWPSLEVNGVSGITIKNLNISGHDYYPGIKMVYSMNSTITGVSVSNRYIGISLDSVSNTVIKDSTISGNSTGISFSTGGQYNTITNNVISNEYGGIYFYNITNTTISDNIITGSDYGVDIHVSSNNTIENNLIAYSSFAGMGLFGYSLNHGSNNTMTGNTVAYSTYGLFSYDSDGNLFYKNNFKNNLDQVSIGGGAHTWNKAAPDGGNYWSDFDTPEEGCANADGDTFCDAAYTVESAQTDLLPWANPIGGMGGAPVVTNILADPNPVPFNNEITLTAHVDSSSTGSTIVATGDRLDDGAWKLMTASDGSYASLAEDVQATLPVFWEAGVHQVCLSAINANGDTSLADNCISLVVDNGNTAPTANPGGPYLGAVNTVIALDGSLSSDPENDPLTYVWNFGDSSADTGATPTHSYTAAGIYNVCLTVDDGELYSDPICTLAVIYDPSAGFVTGGGWLNSPLGAYRPDPSLEGKATFGFVARYQKGTSVPTGNTAFKFDLAGMNFASDSYEWLVVNQNGSNAQFKGSGLINGFADPNGNPYKFILWAFDGSPDTLRIRIWWEDSAGAELEVYDSGTNQAIGAGNIVVHTGK